MHTKTTLPADELISCFNEANDCVKVLDPSATLLSFNDNGYHIMEIDNPNNVLGKNWLELWDGEAGEAARREFIKAQRGHLGYFEGAATTMKGSPRWWQVTIVPLKNHINMVEWILVISRDATELQTLRDENAALKSQLSTS